MKLAFIALCREAHAKGFYTTPLSRNPVMAEAS
jgi:hypothetical protein